MINKVLIDAIRFVEEAAFAYCYYITPNDVGATGSHQCGFYIPKRCVQLFFEEPCDRGSNFEKEVEIKWQNDFLTHSTVRYYGSKTRNEYRLTRFSKGFEFLQDHYIGSLLVMTRSRDGALAAFVLSNQGDIEEFVSLFDLDITVGSQPIQKKGKPYLEDKLSRLFKAFIDAQIDFPETAQMASFARECVNNAKSLLKDKILGMADSLIMKWIDAEYKLFRELEERIYYPVYSQPFKNCQSLVEFSNTILNRRKSRAGKSLEHHLSAIFSTAELKFEAQAVTENNKRPDFLFPDSLSYHNYEFPADRLTMLGAKTTCKDRWRQVITEADRIDEKHLFTLQCGVSKNQLQEMRDAHVKLVVPKANITFFIPEYHDNIMTLADFIAMVKERQG